MQFLSLRFFVPLVAAASVVASLPHAARAQPQTIASLFNTGVNASNGLLAGGATDSHYTMTANNFGSTSTSTFVVGSPPGVWATSTDSKYLAVDGSDGSSVNGGNYAVTYRTTFTLPTNVTLSSVNISGLWSTDNAGTNILINGQPTGITSATFISFTAFTLPTGFYQAGTNTLDFQWNNVGGPGGLNVRFTNKTFTTATNAPEPASFALLGTGLLGMMGIYKRRKSKNHGLSTR